MVYRLLTKKITKAHQHIDVGHAPVKPSKGLRTFSQGTAQGALKLDNYTFSKATCKSIDVNRQLQTSINHNSFMTYDSMMS